MRLTTCSRCGLRKIVNVCTKDERLIGEFCAECWDYVDHDRPGRRPSSSGSGPNHTDPSFDNVVRAAEEDR
jgi:hypothetical protein